MESENSEFAMMGFQNFLQMTQVRMDVLSSLGGSLPKGHAQVPRQHEHLV